MTNETRRTLTALGVFCALLAVAVIGTLAFIGTSVIHGISRSSGDGPAVAAKFGTVTLPKGYRYLAAMDLAVVDTLMVAPRDPARNGFLIELEGMSLGAAPSNSDAMLDQLQKRMGSAAHCESGRTIGTDRIVTASHVAVSLREIDCGAHAGDDRLIELGQIPSKFPFAMVMAMGPKHIFDRDALRSLVRSLR